MIINNLHGIYNNYTVSQNKFKKFQNPSVSDVFIKTTSFKGADDDRIIDDKSFTEFKKWADDTDFLSDVKDIVERTGKILGSGFEGETYEIPGNDKWVIKKYKRGDFVQKHIDEPQIHEIKDFSPKLNVGQFIARVELPFGERYSTIYYILKRQTGKSFGVPYEFSDSNAQDFAAKHLEELKKLALCPDSTFDKCIKDTKYIAEQGYELDCCNPYNFMFDSGTNTINFVDVSDKLRDDITLYGNVLFALLDGHFGINFAESDCEPDMKKDADELSQTIIKKYFRAMKKSNVKFKGGREFEQLLDSKLLDSTLNASSREEKINALKKMNLMD